MQVQPCTFSMSFRPGQLLYSIKHLNSSSLFFVNSPKNGPADKKQSRGTKKKDLGRKQLPKITASGQVENFGPGQLFCVCSRLPVHFFGGNSCPGADLINHHP